MKTCLAALLATLALFLPLLPVTARAAGPIDCSAGCYVVTCNAQLCSLWRCDASGCHYVTGWDRKVVEDPLSAARAGKAPQAGPDLAYVSVCPPGKRCSLYEISATEALRLGSFDNMADLVAYRQSMRGEPVRQR